MLFQSTHPLRGATRHGGVCGQVFQISIHAPLAGCDYRVRNFPFAPRISIHAPLAGCDFGLKLGDFCLLNFNPRTPCGVRLIPLSPFSATPISIHAPLAGCDPITSRPGGSKDEFQSTHPLRGATTVSPSRAPR